MIRILLLSILIYFSVSPANAEDSKLISMQLGGERTLDLRRAPKAITISDPNVVDVQRVGLTNSIRIIPQSTGKANLLLEFPDGGSKEYRIHVAQGKDAITPQLLSQSSGNRVAKTLSQLPGVEAFVESGRVVVTGHIKDIESFRAVARILATSPQSFSSSITLAPGLESLVAEDLTRTMAFLGGPQLTVSFRQGLILLSGISEGATGKQNALSYLRTIFPGAMDGAIEQDGALNLVQIDLHFLEVSRNESTRIGVSRKEGPLAGVDLSNSIAGSSAILSTNFNLFFDALKESHGARELAHPTLLTRSGVEVEFLAGGEIPVVSGRERIENGAIKADRVEYKPYGISFSSQPTLLPSGKIAIDLSTEFSSVDEGLSRDLAPAFHTRKLRTSITLDPDKIALLTGLVRSKDAKGVDKLPGLGSIPILGELFKHRNSRDENSELWIALSAKATANPEAPNPKSLWQNAKPSVENSLFD